MINSGSRVQCWGIQSGAIWFDLGCQDGKESDEESWK